VRKHFSLIFYVGVKIMIVTILYSLNKAAF